MSLEEKLRNQLTVCKSPDGCDKCEVIDMHVCYIPNFIRRWLNIEEE